LRDIDQIMSVLGIMQLRHLNAVAAAAAAREFVGLKREAKRKQREARDAAT
jgi:hypothetical protein